ncbi:MAG: hypothetical protein E7565_04860 [Ruminococcaceae bacterium]|nr:hypothetical protein [Oscillospiraceae bacterium]
MNEISLSSIISIILRRIWLVIIVAVLCAALAFGYCNFLATPVYSAKTSILITNGGLITDNRDDSIQTNDLSASIYLVDTCVDILKSQGIYQDLSTAIGEKYSFSKLKGAFSISKRDDENLFIDISFKSTNPEEAMLIANTFTDLCPQYMSGKLPPVTVEVMDKAYKASMVYPSTISSTFIFGLLGAVVTCVLLVLFASLDQTIKSEEDFTETFTVPVLGSVPNFDNSPTYAYRAKTGSVSTGG